MCLCEQNVCSSNIHFSPIIVTSQRCFHFVPRNIPANVHRFPVAAASGTHTHPELGSPAAENAVTPQVKTCLARLWRWLRLLEPQWLGREPELVPICPGELGMVVCEEGAASQPGGGGEEGAVAFIGAEERAS